MCEPVTILTVGAMAVGAYATYQSGQTEKAFAEREAQQTVADAQAERGDAKVEADRIMRMKAAALAETNAGIAGSGQDLGSAGALQLNRAVSTAANEDAFFALIGGDRRGQRMEQQAKLTRARGQAAARGATYSAFGQLAQAGATGYSGWLKSKGKT